MTRLPVVIAFACFALILGIPFALRSSAPQDERRDVPRVIIITPHVRQISEEFTIAFKRWYKAHHASSPSGGDVDIDWRGPFGTSEIVKLLQAQYTAAMQRELDRVIAETPDKLLDPSFNLDASIKTGDIGFDLFFGGGSFDHTRVKARETASIAARVLPKGGLEEITLSKMDAIDLTNLSQIKELRGFVSIAGKPPVKLTIPVAAIEGGSASVEAIAKDTANGGVFTAKVQTSRLTRDFGVVMSQKAGLSKEEIAVLGDGTIGAERLYDPDQYWIGTALSSFGIVFNRDLMEDAGFKRDPERFGDLTNPKLAGLVALADPRQSGSLTTAIDMLISSHVWEIGARNGWGNLLAERGVIEKAIAAGHGEDVDEAWRQAWRTLREVTANARYYASSSTKPPIDVAQGDAAAGLAIDFYGKGQAQAILRPGQDPATGRVGYIDPIGQTTYDADPVTILTGGPSPDLAREFVRFCLTKEAQSLWQFRVGDTAAPKGESGAPLGPAKYELRRLPIRPDMYEEPYFGRFIDQVKPFERAPKAKPVGWRDAIGIMMPAFAVDVAEDQREAWDTINRCRRSDEFPRETLLKMEELFYGFPTTKLADGRELAFTPKDFPALASAWREAKKNGRLKQDYVVKYTQFFRESYREVVRLGRE